MPKSNDKTFYRITNRDIYEKLDLIEERLNANKFQEKLQWIATGILAVFIGLGKYIKEFPLIS